MQIAVRNHRRRLFDRACGRVLDLGGAATHGALWDARVGDRRVGQEVDRDVVVLDGGADPRLLHLARDGARFDTVVSVFQFAAAPDLAAAIARVGQVLEPAGRILFLEPGRLAGLAGRSQRLLAPFIAVTTGWHVDRDVPMALRQVGLSVTDLERHRTGTTQWWLRFLVVGTAHHALAPRRGPGT